MGFTDDLRASLTGATLRKIIGLPDVLSDARLANFTSNNSATIAKNYSDVYVSYTESMTGSLGVGRLFTPGNAFYRLPRTGDSLMVLKPSLADGPGVPYVFHGDGNTSGLIPAWLSHSDSGIALPENLHLEAGGSIMIKSSSGAASGGGAHNQDGVTTATITLGQDGTITISGGQGVNVNVQANGGGTLNLTAQTAALDGTTATQLGSNPIKTPVLTFGSIDSMGVPVTNSPTNTGTVTAG